MIIQLRTAIIAFILACDVQALKLVQLAMKCSPFNLMELARVSALVDKKSGITRQKHVNLSEIYL